MATVHFTSNLRRHVDCPSVESTGGTVRTVLDGAFASNLLSSIGLEAKK